MTLPASVGGSTVSVISPLVLVAEDAVRDAIQKFNETAGLNGVALALRGAMYAIDAGRKSPCGTRMAHAIKMI